LELAAEILNMTKSRGVLGLGLGFRVGSLGALALVCLSASAGLANPRGFEGNYVGATVDASNFEDGVHSLLGTGSAGGWVADQAQTGEGRAPGQRQLQTRIDLAEFPISVRGAVVLGDEIEAVMPMLSYDVPLGDRANIYAGAGYAFVRPGAQTALGDRNGPVLNTGVEASITHNVVLYGDMRIHPRTQADQDPIRFQVGIGRRF